ncbi:hypothetical protein PV11_01533 [Exophiala sideris]|uniref:Uncharacterized protein n=1 Tax=Exophiala sideris TaxID=1016849 RepID=A0A0D1XDB9_9EURO|nr:hypothetical protein PV11_01533 [Exophiala sideris]
MDGVSVASGIAGLISLAIQVSGTITTYYNAIKERSKNVRELLSELELLGHVLCDLRDFLQSKNARGLSFDTNSILQKAISDCRDRIERIGDALKPSDGGRLARAFDKLTWPFEHKDVIQMIQNLRAYRETFHFAVTLENCKLLSQGSDDVRAKLQEILEAWKATQELFVQKGLPSDEASKKAAQLEQIIGLVPMLAKTSDGVNELSQTARLAELREQERRTSDILDWLAPVSWLHKHRDLQLKLAQGTGNSFLQHPDFASWHDHTSNHDLLCIGGPGAGKSMLCALVVDHLRAKFKRRDVIVTYYYYDYAEQLSQNPTHLARSLLRQLCSARDTVPPCVAEFYQRSRNDVKDQTWFHDLLLVLGQVVATYAQCFIVVDALDEADVQSQRRGLFEVMDAMRNSRGNAMRLLVTARPHILNATSRFHNPVTIDIMAEPQDIRLFLTKAIDDHRDYGFTMDDNLRAQVLDTLCNSANGMFLLPALHIQTILDQITKADVKRTLKHLSTNLTGAFQSTIERISSLAQTRRDLALKTLMWTSHATRPLKVCELQHAIAVRLGDNDLDTGNLPPEQALVACCCGLVVVDPESSNIRLVHRSLEEYLRDHDHGLFGEANLLMTRTCLHYISLDPVKSLPTKNRNDFAAGIEDLPFLTYAALEWGHHAYSTRAKDIRDLALPVLSDHHALLTIARVRDHQSPDFRKWKERAWEWATSHGAGISLASAFGLTQLVQLLIHENKYDLRLDARNLYGSTPLHEAAFNGHDSVAELLLEHGANLLDTNYGSATPLYLAVTQGRLSTIKALLKHGRQQLDIPGPRGFTALHKAAEQGNEEMVATILEAGALVAAHDNHGMTALHLAARRGYLSVSRLLVSHGAIVHVRDKDDLCPLDHAATGGYVELVEYLLENGGSLTHKGHEHWIPLHRAARGGHTKTVAFLLGRSVNVLATDLQGSIPLHLAVRSGKMATVEALLKHDPNVRQAQLSAQDKKGSTPREVAFYTAHYDIHKYLRATEWAITGGEPSNTRSLTGAIERGHLETVRALLDVQPELLESRDEDGQPPLHVAVQEKQIMIIEFLLDCGASIELVGFHGWRALHIAASLGDVDLVNLCLAHGASVNTRTHTQQTPLHKAASSHSVAVLQRLIEAGADLAAMNARGMTALHIAAHQNDIQMIRILVLEYGMDVLARDRLGLTPSMWAERSNHLDVLAFLRAEVKKAKLTRKNVAGLTANRSVSAPDIQELAEALSDADFDGDSPESSPLPSPAPRPRSAQPAYTTN